MALRYYVVKMIVANLLRFSNEIEGDDKTAKKLSRQREAC